MASSSTKLSLKLLIDTKQEKVLFAEASKDVVDFLFNLLCLPVSTVIRLLDKKGMVGCIGNLYQSVEDLNHSYMQADQVNKHLLLRPLTPISSAQVSALLPPNTNFLDHNEVPTSSTFYRCGQSGMHSCSFNYVTCDSNTRCPSCSRAMNVKVQFVGNNVSSEAHQLAATNGFVKEVVTYVVMDDLVIQPMSSITTIVLLNKLNVKDVGALKELVVEFGMSQGVNLLKASLQSKNVLTTVFLDNKGAS